MLKEIKAGVTAPQGFKAAGVQTGIKSKNKNDIGIIYSIRPAAAAAMFTTNKIPAAPIIVSKEAAADGCISAVVVNSGCANACTGAQGLADAQAMAQLIAQVLHTEPSQVLVASTGVIGVNLPMDKIAHGIKTAAATLKGESPEADEDIAKTIMTTDTFQKSSAYEFILDGKKVKIAGIAKGSGMIHPNMATMLAFITTDAAISVAMLKKALAEAVQLSFNMITVDGDTSTNDMICVLANGLAGNTLISSDENEGYRAFSEALRAVCANLAKLVVRDGEGATKFLEINVSGAASFDDAKEAAMSVAKSPLVKTAFFGEDPNWGRILCAAGYSKALVNPDAVSLSIGSMPIVTNGQKAPAVDSQALKKIMSARDISLEINLGAGTAKATVWTCDFSYEYVKINGEYTT